MTKRGSEPTGYALITGASSGIGVDFAMQLAERGYDLILTARRQAKLDHLADLIGDQHRVDVQVIRADLADDAGADFLYQAVDELGITVEVLINNAGLGVEVDFLDEYDHVDKTVGVNLESATRMIWLFGGDMQERKQGMILNVSSFSTFMPPTKLAVYAATKSYLYTLSTALAPAFRKDNVLMTALCPGFFESEFFEKSGVEPSRLTRMFTMSSDSVARAGLKGMFRGKPLVVPGFYYKSSLFLMRILPKRLANTFANMIMK